MIGSTRAIRVWAWPLPVDLRKGFNGLYALVINQLQMDPLAGDYFLFVNRKRSSCKVLHWDGTGLCIYMKRLRRQRFPALWRETTDRGVVAMTSTELALFIEGSKEIGYRSLSPPATR